MREFVERYGPSILTQDNAITAEPVYNVEERCRIYGMDPAYGEDDWIWQHQDGGEADDEDQEMLDAKRRNHEAIPEEWEQIYYIDTWQTVASFFLLINAEAYIERNKHNLNHPRLYVDSAYRNPEWQFIRDLIIQASVAKEEEGE